MRILNSVKRFKDQLKEVN